MNDIEDTDDAPQPRFKGQVYSKRCNQCLFSDARIVDAERKADVIATCRENDTHFTCHKATLRGEDVACRGFYDNEKGVGKGIRIAHALGILTFIPLPEDES